MDNPPPKIKTYASSTGQQHLVTEPDGTILRVSTYARPSLTRHNGQYRVSCGFWFGRNGERVPRVWMLGDNHDLAANLAGRLKQCWKLMKELSPGLDVWTEEWEQFARHLHERDIAGQPVEKLMSVAEYKARHWRYDGHPAGTLPYNLVAAIGEARRKASDKKPTRYPKPLPETLHTAPEARPQPNRLPSLSLHQGIEDYLHSLEIRVPHQLSRSHYEGQYYAMQRLKAHADDVPLEKIGYDELAKIVAYFSSRPATKTGAKMATDTALNTIKYAEDLFGYLQRSGKWSAPAYCERAFFVKKKSMMTGAEKKKAARGQDTLTTDEIAALWKAGKFREGNEQARLYLVLGLNICCTQMQLSDPTASSTLAICDVGMAANCTGTRAAAPASSTPRDWHGGRESHVTSTRTVVSRREKIKATCIVVTLSDRLEPTRVVNLVAGVSDDALASDAPFRAFVEHGEGTAHQLVARLCNTAR